MHNLPDKSLLAEKLAEHRDWPEGLPDGVTPEPVAEGEESVWSFPRPPLVEPVHEVLRVEFAGQVIAETTKGHRICETASAPCYFFPPEDVKMAFIQAIPGQSTMCEWKGIASYFDVTLGSETSHKAAFSYPDPIDDLGQGFRDIPGHLCFYASRVDAAFIGDEQVTPQPGEFYAGWVTRALKGPIKGEPGTGHW